MVDKFAAFLSNTPKPSTAAVTNFMAALVEGHMTESSVVAALSCLRMRLVHIGQHFRCATKLDKPHPLLTRESTPTTLDPDTPAIKMDMSTPVLLSRDAKAQLSACRSTAAAVINRHQCGGKVRAWWKGRQRIYPPVYFDGS